MSTNETMRRWKLRAKRILWDEAGRPDCHRYKPNMHSIHTAEEDCRTMTPEMDAWLKRQADKAEDTP